VGKGNVQQGEKIMGTEEKYLTEVKRFTPIKFKAFDRAERIEKSINTALKANYEAYDQDKVEAIIEVIDLFVENLYEEIDNFPLYYKETLEKYKGILTAKEKNAIRNHIDSLKTIDIERFIKGVIW
jgi:hypothetical protein